MANLPSFEELLCAVPQEKQHLLDGKVEDYQLAKIAKNITHWQEVAPYLGLTEAEETAIEENNNTAERRRFVSFVCSYHRLGWLGESFSKAYQFLLKCCNAVD